MAVKIRHERGNKKTEGAWRQCTVNEEECQLQTHTLEAPENKGAEGREIIEGGIKQNNSKFSNGGQSLPLKTLPLSIKCNFTGHTNHI